MPKSTKQGSTRTQQAREFLLALETERGGGPDLPHKKCLAEWRFVDRRKYDCAPTEKRYLLEYELAREAEAQGLTYRSSATWRTIFGSRFPKLAFLSIKPDQRRTTLAAAFSKPDTGVPLFDFTTEWGGISYSSNYALLPAYRAELDGMIAVESEGAKVEATESVVSTTVSKFMGSLPAEAYDESVAHVRMTIDFDYSDDALKDAFAAILASLRRRDSLPGKKDEVDARLKQLAAARLHRIFGTVQAAQNYLAECDFDLPYAGDEGWSKARSAVRKLLGVSVPK